MTIPLLAGAPDGPPVYALALAKFYPKSRGDIPKINFLYPYIPVDEITMNDYGAFLAHRGFLHRWCVEQTHSAHVLSMSFEEQSIALSSVFSGLQLSSTGICDCQ